MRILLTLVAAVYLHSIGCLEFCTDSVCPVNESDGIYPNCTCRHKNFDYSVTLNKCFRVCPVNSAGYWPECKCDSGGYFSKKFFTCFTNLCPPNSKGQYPDCICNEVDAAYNNIRNICEKCKGGSYGTFPNCNCPDGAIYERNRGLCVHGCVRRNNGNGSMESDDCMLCPGFPYGPFISTGDYPNCTCKDWNSVYDELLNTCIYCPEDSTGVHPNCTCKNGSSYNETQNICNKCSSDSDGVHPKCICHDPKSIYIMHLNGCYACPPGSTGDYPNCKCDNAFFSERLNRCIKCPTDATGMYPACNCLNANLTFSAFINECYHQCPGNSFGIQPNCQCDEEYFYDADERVCKSNSARNCPSYSIGIGPDCLCILEHERFDLSSWSCRDKYISVVYTDFSANYFTRPTSCPNKSKKWPQCGNTVSDCVLRSCIG